nr:MAG TPA: hypothetical protein [Caudoviricetes sp.]
MRRKTPFHHVQKRDLSCAPNENRVQKRNPTRKRGGL